MIILSAGIAALLFGVDLLLKQYVEENMDCGEEIEAVKDKVILRKVYNKGFMLHALERYPWLVRGSAAFLGAVLFIYDVLLSGKKGRRVEKAGTAIFSAGAYSNIFDRLVRGKVIDYIGFKSKSGFLSRLTVNLADLCIVAGLAVMTLGKLFTGAGPRSKGA